MRYIAKELSPMEKMVDAIRLCARQRASIKPSNFDPGPLKSYLDELLPNIPSPNASEINELICSLQISSWLKNFPISSQNACGAVSALSGMSPKDSSLQAYFNLVQMIYC